MLKYLSSFTVSLLTKALIPEIFQYVSSLKVSIWDIEREIFHRLASCRTNHFCFCQRLGKLTKLGFEKRSQARPKKFVSIILCFEFLTTEMRMRIHSSHLHTLKLRKRHAMSLSLMQQRSRRQRMKIAPIA
jgi:hypothetical protein